jgi:putative hydrolase of the HAD superfamily
MIPNFSLSDALCAQLIARIRGAASPLTPIPTAVSPRLPTLRNIRCVLFDVYGTILVSGAGEVGSGNEAGDIQLYRNALHAAGFTVAPDFGSADAALFPRRIQEEHNRLRSSGIANPEVDIRVIWWDVLNEWSSSKKVVGALTPTSALIVALEYELRTNPVWPMPNLRRALTDLKNKNITLGIVSNAQFYTPVTLAAFDETAWREGFFAEEHCAWSWWEKVAKPDPALFTRVLQRLYERRGLLPHEILCVGNDILNDIRPACALGCRTALFAGDVRSLRLREGEPQVHGIRPDAVITDLSQLSQLVGSR